MHAREQISVQTEIQALSLRDGSEPTETEDHHQQTRSNGGRDQAVLAKLADDEGLQIEQPHADEKHRDDQRRQNLSGDLIAKESENGETKNRKIRRRTNCCQRHSGDHGVLAAEHFRATGKNRAADCLPCDVLDREVKRVSESEQ